MFEKDNVTEEQFKEAYNFLNSLEGEFWKPNILCTKTLRKQISKLIMQKHKQNGKSEQQVTTNTKRSAGFTIAGAEKTLLADAERKLRKVEGKQR